MADRLLVAVLSLSVVLFVFVIQSPSTEASNVHFGAFNIQRFGVSKAEDPEVMNVLVKIIRRYHLIIIEEITDRTGTAVQKLLSEINSVPSTIKFELFVSPRLGRTDQKEQFGFFYRPRELTNTNGYVYDDRDNKFERPPYVAVFTTGSFNFSVVSVHTKPTDAVSELQHLHLVAENAVKEANSENVIVMGDFNADCDYVRKKWWPSIPLWTNPLYMWLIPSTADTTTSPRTHCAYDRIVVAGNKLRSSVITSSGKVFKFDDTYGLNENQTAAVSDHYPVEAKFRIPVEPSSRLTRSQG